MNAVEIEAAVSDLASAPYDAAEFPFQFLAAFDKRETTLKRLRKGDSNKSDVPGAVLLINNIHLAACPAGQTRETLDRLKASPKTASSRAKFIFATDGSYFEAEDVSGGVQEPVADFLPNLANHFGFFLPLAGISTVREIKDNPIDVRATGRLNKLYVELLRINPEWGTAARRHDMNHFMARLIFCYFAEHTDIFEGRNVFTLTVEQMSEGDGSNTHQVIEQIFRAMDVKIGYRMASGVPPYADHFPYVNGGLFSGSAETPRFNRIARSYLLQAGKLEWQHINPDIFGSMIQAVADDEERGALGMHYTSVPNILKLLNLRQRMSRIRVFDPACGSGNFLVIAYKQMRSIEAEINRRRGESMRPTDISTKNFRGIELRDFAAEVARLALVIAEYQCDVQHRGPLAAKAEFLPLNEMNWITCGNALRLDWLEVCPPEGTSVKLHSDDLFQTPLDQPEIDFENQAGETFICGNPPYKGSQSQDSLQKNDLEDIFVATQVNWKGVDYVAGWFQKAARYFDNRVGSFAFVSTNSICQGKAVAGLWPHILGKALEISFAYTSFKWSNLASHNAGVTVIIVGVGKRSSLQKVIYAATDGGTHARQTSHINAYLVPAPEIYVKAQSEPLSDLSQMVFGNMPIDGGFLSFTKYQLDCAKLPQDVQQRYIRRIYGAAEYIRSQSRYCLWVPGTAGPELTEEPTLKMRLEQVQAFRESSKRPGTRILADQPHHFGWVSQSGREVIIIIPRILSERRQYITVGYESAGTLTTDQAYTLHDTPLWNVSLLSSTLHLVWVATVCGKLKTDLRYSNTLGWNTFPVPALTEQNKADLTRCAEDILLAREAHFPLTIADLYNPETMPENLRAAHEANDEVLERIYIGRRFRNDTERLEKLFEMYRKMAATPGSSAKPADKRARRATA